MESDYLTVPVFIAFALLFPASIILFSRLIRIRTRQNAVSRLNFESSEESTGSRLSIMTEYFHYFSAFLAFEVIAAIVLVWVSMARSLPRSTGIAVLAVTVLGMMMEMLAILLATRR